MQPARMLPGLIAPCGMNCAVCVAYFGETMAGKRRKHACGGCRTRRSRCAFIKQHCGKLSANRIGYCYECDAFPCGHLRVLDSRYRAKYGMSMIENLRQIQDKGMDQFLQSERERWKCPGCGGIVCVHNRKCYGCNQNWPIGNL